MMAPLARVFMLAFVLTAPALTAAQATTAPPAAVSLLPGSGERVKGSGRIVEQPRDVGFFGAVHVSGPIDVELRAAERDSVTVRADDNILELIETRIGGGERPVLEIGVVAGASFRTARSPKVIVEFRALNDLVMRGSGDVRADRLAADDFALSMSGSGDARIGTLHARRFAAVLAGSGDLVVRGGRAWQQAYRLSGSGDVGAGRLEGRDVQVAIRGSGDASVYASGTLQATIEGSGDVVYRGTPDITRQVRGSGTVRKAN
jgi:hypothetical protein